MTLADFILVLQQSIPVWVLAIIFVVAVIVIGIMTWVFFYHWDQYGTNSIMTLQLQAVYTIGIAVILGLAIFSLLTY